MLLHGAVIGSALLWSWWQARGREQWGDPNSQGGGSVAVQAVSQIPLPARPGPVNPVANDTESETPTPKQEKATAKKPVEDPDAVALKMKREKRKLTDVAAATQRYKTEVKPNQVASEVGQRAVSPMFGVPGAGGVGTGTGSPLGTRFGWYEALLRQRVAQNWRTQEIPAQIRMLPVAVVTFTIYRDGSVKEVKVLKSSGNYQLDSTAQRAVYDSAPFPPLPPQFERDSARIEFWFELKR